MRVNEVEILAGHFEASRNRVAATEGPILVIRTRASSLSSASTLRLWGSPTPSTAARIRPAVIGCTRCGLLMHTSLAVTTDGLPLGLAAIKFWNRQKFKGTAALKRKINPTRVPIEQKESFRWLENMRQSTALF
jgi:hypothetical protein